MILLGAVCFSRYMPDKVKELCSGQYTTLYDEEGLRRVRLCPGRDAKNISLNFCRRRLRIKRLKPVNTT